MSNPIHLEPVVPGRRRRYTPEQKQALLDEAQLPGKSISLVAREYGVSPSVLFQWKRVMDDATNKSLQRNEKVVPESEAKKLKARIRELERMLGKKTMENEILQEALEVCREVAREKKLTSRGGSSDEGDGQ